MTKLEQNETCSLHYAVDMCRALTDGLVKMDQVYQYRGTVIGADLRDKVCSRVDSAQVVIQLLTQCSHPDG